MKAFDLVMGGVSPWDEKRNNQLRISNKTAKEAFADMRGFYERESGKLPDGSHEWQYIILAPHIDSDKGLLSSQQAQVLELFQHSEIAGLELGDNSLPKQTIKDRLWLKEGMSTHRQGFFHSSDAYHVNEIGKRYSWIKVASPRVEAIRQAFIANDSRIRIAYQKKEDSEFQEIAQSPDVTMNNRPWLKSVTVSGAASFFGDNENSGTTTRFDLSPDLTCIIGGSMTGKSTFLDGLRLHIGASMPQDARVRDQVEARGKLRFLGGSPEIDLECPGQDPTAPLYEQWPAVFYSQSELQNLAQNPEAVEDILARLVSSETQGIKEREQFLNKLDSQLGSVVKDIDKLSEDLAEAEQAFERSKSAAEELSAFSDAGVDELNGISSYMSEWKNAVRDSIQMESQLDAVKALVDAFAIPEATDTVNQTLIDADIPSAEERLAELWNNFRELMYSANGILTEAKLHAIEVRDRVESKVEEFRIAVDRQLADLGFDASRINELQALNVQASLKNSYKANYEEIYKKREEASTTFNKMRKERKKLVLEQRKAFDRVIDAVNQQFDGQILARRQDEGRKQALGKLIRDLGQRGVTRWWNDLSERNRPSSEVLLKRLRAGKLRDIGMSQQVESTFVESTTPKISRRLAAIRCNDEYLLEYMLDDGSYRRLDELSGGQRVNLLLSLLLKTSDERPLVIDQPEDELDNRYFFDTMLPVLKELKGRRQIVLATHNANIVVNGDADQVIQLEATADHGRVFCSGAIEDPEVKDAIVQTVDGGDEAFRLRYRKYGF